MGPYGIRRISGKRRVIEYHENEIELDGKILVEPTGRGKVDGVSFHASGEALITEGNLIRFRIPSQIPMANVKMGREKSISGSISPRLREVYKWPWRSFAQLMKDEQLPFEKGRDTVASYLFWWAYRRSEELRYSVDRFFPGFTVDTVEPIFGQSNIEIAKQWAKDKNVNPNDAIELMWLLHEAW